MHTTQTLNALDARDAEIARLLGLLREVRNADDRGWLIRMDTRNDIREAVKNAERDGIEMPAPRTGHERDSWSD